MRSHITIMTDCDILEYATVKAKSKVVMDKHTKTMSYFDLPSFNVNTKESQERASKLTDEEIDAICIQSVPFIMELPEDIIAMARNEVKRGSKLLVCSAKTCGCTCRRISACKLCHCQIKRINPFHSSSSDPMEACNDVSMALMLDEQMTMDMMSAYDM